MDTNLYLLRHFERIDDSGAINKEMDNNWNKKDSSIFSHNPYLSDKAYEQKNIEKVVKNIPDIQLIDIIITSPFLRCLQTSLIMMDKINQKKNESSLEPISNIFVDFGLCEYIDDFIFYDITMPYNLMNIYNNSICYLNEKGINTPFEIFNYQPNNITEYENDESYIKRIRETIKKINECFYGKNILIVSHSYSCMIIDKQKKLEYYEPIKIEQSILSSSSSSSSSSFNSNATEYKIKYNKYKTKYLELKQKIGGFNNNELKTEYFNKLKELYPKCILKGNETTKSTETYGEMEYNGIEKINLEFNKNNQIEYFIDIGSGRGKLTCWFAGIPNVIKSYGIEIVQSRYNDAVKLKDQLFKSFPTIAEKIELKCADISKINLRDLTNNSSDCLIWISNLCFDQELSNKIFGQILDQTEIGTMISCSKKPFEKNLKSNNKYYKFIKELEIKMSWTDNSKVFIYQVSI